MTTPNTPAFGLSAQEIKKRDIVAKSLLVGASAGMLSSAFRLGLTRAENVRVWWITSHPGVGGALSSLAIGALGGGLSVWLVRRFSPAASGSGIPQLKAVVLGKRPMEWRKLIPIKFLAGICGIGSGLALGREGPTIQMGGGTGLMVSELLQIKSGQGDRKALISAGAGAGLAAAFNAPLSGMVFVLEELHGEFTPAVFIAAFLAAVVADIVARVLTGASPVFAVQVHELPQLSILPLAALLGAILGFIGVAFNRLLLKSLDLFSKLQGRPAFLVGASVGLSIGIIGYISPGTVGSGGQIAERTLAGDIALEWVPLIFLSRFVLTLVSYGCGAAGGIFAPLLVLGALTGILVGAGGHYVMPTWIPDQSIFPVLGMGALLASVVRAPLTGIVLMVELTGQYSIMLPLLTACLCAYGVAEGLKDTPIYEALLERSFEHPSSSPSASVETPPAS